MDGSLYVSFLNYSERFNKVVIARSEATCLHAEVLAAGVTARRRGNLMRLLHFVRNDNMRTSTYL